MTTLSGWWIYLVANGRVVRCEEGIGGGKGVRRNLMKQMETRVNCANTRRRNGMNGGPRVRKRKPEREKEGDREKEREG